MIDRSGEPCLMDFGLAKRESGEITMTAEGEILGTPAYMSPEQARGEGHTVDRRTDIYSVGAASESQTAQRTRCPSKSDFARRTVWRQINFGRFTPRWVRPWCLTPTTATPN